MVPWLRLISGRRWRRASWSAWRPRTAGLHTAGPAAGRGLHPLRVLAGRWLAGRRRAEPAQPGAMTAGTPRVAAGRHVAGRGHCPRRKAGPADRTGVPMASCRIRSHGDQPAGDRPVSLTSRRDQIAQHGGYLLAARGRELPENTCKLLLPPCCGPADQMPPGGGEFESHHAAVARLAAPGDVAGSVQPVSEAAHRGGVQAQRPGYLSGPGPPQGRQRIRAGAPLPCGSRNRARWRGADLGGTGHARLDRAAGRPPGGAAVRRRREADSGMHG
jgi:hypothetical protein